MTARHDPFPFQASVFYPGSRVDYRPVHAFARLGLADSFIYADDGVPLEEIRASFEGKGLHLMDQDDWNDFLLKAGDEEILTFGRQPRDLPDYELDSMADLPLDTLVPPATTSRLPQAWVPKLAAHPQVPPFALSTVFKLRAGHPLAPSWPERVRILFLGAEALTMYDRLFCQEGRQAPRAAMIQPGMHTGGDNWTPLQHLAQSTGRLPEYLLMDLGAAPWDGYKQFAGDIWRRIE